MSSVDDVPTHLSTQVYIVSRGGSDRWAMLTCPCGCGERLDVNLMRAKWPHWRLRRHDGTISISPSLWVSEERCGSHFWLVRNRVFWAQAHSEPERPSWWRRLVRTVVRR